MLPAVDVYTSTGIKFWKHPVQMLSYKNGHGNTVVSTHISPTSDCNLSCSYCSVRERSKGEIPIAVIEDYINKLCSRGLLAAIITGGGEPLLYSCINDIIQYLLYKSLKVGLITNGTMLHKLKHLDDLSWIRISINDPSVITRINTPATVGGSIVYQDHSISDLIYIGEMAANSGYRYIRVLPDCLHQGEDLSREHLKIALSLAQVNNPIFFHQMKTHQIPYSSICHQAYFRPYLSEVDGGTVYPCDSLVLCNSSKKFISKYQICHAHAVLDFLDHKIPIPIDPSHDCHGCVFTDTVNQLDEWKSGRIPYQTVEADIPDEEFV